MLLMTGMHFVHPESALPVDGRLYVSDIGEFGKRDGKVYVREGKTWKVWASGLFDPKGMAYCGGRLFVADVVRVWEIKGKSLVFNLVGPRHFKAEFLNGIACGARYKLLLSDTHGNAVYEVDVRKREVRKLFDVDRPNGVVYHMGKVFVITFTSPGRILMWSGEKLDTVVETPDLNGGDGLVYVPERGYFIASGYESGKVVKVTLDGRVEVIASGLKTPAGIGFDGKYVYVPLLETGELKRYPVE